MKPVGKKKTELVVTFLQEVLTKMTSLINRYISKKGITTHFLILFMMIALLFYHAPYVQQKELYFFVSLSIIALSIMSVCLIMFIIFLYSFIYVLINKIFFKHTQENLIKKTETQSKTVEHYIDEVTRLKFKLNDAQASCKMMNEIIVQERAEKLELQNTLIEREEYIATLKNKNLGGIQNV